MKIRKRIWEILEIAGPDDAASRAFDIFILVLIFLNVVAVIIGSVESVEREWGNSLYWFEFFSVVCFTIEYFLRLWSCTVDERFKGIVKGRLKLATRVLTIIDLLAFLPFYLPMLGLDWVLRLLRVLRLLKGVRYYSSLKLIKYVFENKKEELVLSSVLRGKNGVRCIF